MKMENEIDYRVSPNVTNDELNKLFAAAWNEFESTDFRPVLKRSLAFVCAYHSQRLVGFVNLAWDGGSHAFVLDTTVHPDYQRRGIGKRLIEKAVEAASERNVEWLHVDFEPHLQNFYDKCGFKSTQAGLIKLNKSRSS